MIEVDLRQFYHDNLLLPAARLGVALSTFASHQT